jgi:hypothetical protein
VTIRSRPLEDQAPSSVLGFFIIQKPARGLGPQACAVFLSEESGKGLAHVLRIKKAISAVHKMADQPDPTTELLVQAIIRLCRKDKSPPTAQPSQSKKENWTKGPYSSDDLGGGSPRRLFVQGRDVAAWEHARGQR